MKSIKTVIVVSFLFLISACETDDRVVTPEAKSIEEIYAAAVIDAMIADSNEIRTNLVTIEPGNNYLSWSDGRVLVVTWTKYSSSYPVSDTISTWWGETWVTAAPELKDWFKKNTVSQNNLVLRTEQLFGLPANSGYTYFVELWVRPDDLLRPAYDNEINDNTCGLSFTETVSSDYIAWFNNNIIYSYYPQKSKSKYPWTRLGYTYDWGNTENEKGLSEFIVKKDAPVIVKSVNTTEEYIK